MKTLLREWTEYIISHTFKSTVHTSLHTCCNTQVSSSIISFIHRDELGTFSIARFGIGNAKMVERLGVVTRISQIQFTSQIIFTPNVSTADCCLLQWYGIQIVCAPFMRVVTGDDKMMCE